ncbi:MAG TPA: extracellular solute-binding protein [Acholeplasmataceae bacterium]|nr:extracellular solute-binding protein [Acholeplasmataceae bacterium]
MQKIKDSNIYKKIADFFKQVKETLKAIGWVKIIIFLILFIFIVVIISSFFQRTAINAFYKTEELAYKYETSDLDNSYTNYLLEKGNNKSNVELTILPSNMVGSIVLLQDSEYTEYFDSYQEYKESTNTLGILEKRNDEITLDINISKTGFYYIEIDYLDLNKQINDNQISILINGESPYFEAQTIKLPSNYYFDREIFLKDRYKNEIQPSSSKKTMWQTSPLKDYDGLHPGFLGFYLKPGDVISLKHNAGKYLVGQVRFIKEEVLPTYEEYLDKVEKNYPSAYISKSAREIESRTSASIRLRAERDPSSKYYDTQFLVLNTIAGDSWFNGGEAVTYDIEVQEAGLYKLAFKYRQAELTDMSTFRKIYINGKVPYKDLESVSFPYSNTFVNRVIKNENNEDLYVYLEKGINKITLEVVNYPYRNLIESIKLTMREIQDLALGIKKYTSGGTDRYRDWDIELYFPNANEQLLEWADRITDIYNELLVVSMKDAPSEISNLKVAATRLRRLAKDINKLPSRMVQFSDGDSSVNQLLGDLMQRMMRGNLELEQTIIFNNNTLKKPFSNIFKSSWEGFKRLILSYFNNPYAVSKKGKDEMMVWVNHPRQYIEIMQMLIDSQFDSNLKITLSQMPDENRLILANTTGQSPDVAIGVNHWLPYEFAIRDASLDLRQFEGFEEIVRTMNKGAFIPMVFEDGVYGLPETQNFWVTYYRTDILDSIGITEIPQTWDEVISILPLLQSYGMNYFVPLAQYEGLKPFVATLPFVYQFEGDLYTENGMSTAINSEETLKGIKLMSDLFTLYNLPQRVGSFYNDFRYGLLPIGIADLSIYLLLSNAAVELDGLWHMDLYPGQLNKAGDEILRYAPIGGQTSMILSDTKFPEESFRFLKWWMSTEIQTEFQFRLETTYGKQYFWNSANNEAFMASSIPSEFKDVIFEQWKYGIEAARIPGTYMVERSISNTWSEIVYNGSNPRLALDEAVRVSNREIRYKMAEFGYVVNNEIVKEYRVPSIYNIDEWLKEVGK